MPGGAQSSDWGCDAPVTAARRNSDHDFWADSTVCEFWAEKTPRRLGAFHIHVTGGAMPTGSKYSLYMYSRVLMQHHS